MCRASSRPRRRPSPPTPGGGEGRAVFKWLQPLARTLNQFLKNVVGNAFLEHADSDRVVGIATKDLRSNAVWVTEKFQPQTIADDV